MGGEALPGYGGVTSLWRAAVWRLAVAKLRGSGGVRHHSGTQPGGAGDGCATSLRSTARLRRLSLPGALLSTAPVYGLLRGSGL